MYNPYLEEGDFLPVEGEETQAQPLLKGNSLLSTDSPMPQLVGDIMSKLGGFSGMAQLFSKKEKPPPKEKGDSEGGVLQGLKERFHLEELESGDILLVIIVIYLMLEGDDKLELAITMGILALMWYLDHKDKD